MFAALRSTNETAPVEGASIDVSRSCSRCCLMLVAPLTLGAPSKGDTGAPLMGNSTSRLPLPMVAFRNQLRHPWQWWC